MLSNSMHLRGGYTWHYPHHHVNVIRYTLLSWTSQQLRPVDMLQWFSLIQ